jgi:PKD repeat protein
MRKLLRLLIPSTVPMLAMLVAGCDSKSPVGPGAVTITETTTTTTVPAPTTTTTIPLPTVASFVFSPITPEEIQTVNFNAAASVPGTDRRIVSYSWDFGDGVMKTGVTSTHDFFPSGIYLVTLTVADDLGKTFSSAQPTTVRPAVPRTP